MSDEQEDRAMLAKLRRLHEAWAAERDAVLNGHRPLGDRAELAKASLTYYQLQHGARLLALAEEGARLRAEVDGWKEWCAQWSERNALLRARVAELEGDARRDPLCWPCMRDRNESDGLDPSAERADSYVASCDGCGYDMGEGSHAECPDCSGPSGTPSPPGMIGAHVCDTCHGEGQLCD